MGLLKTFGFEYVKKNKHPTIESHISNILDHYNIDFVLDVGANNGGFGKVLRKNGYQGTIHSFEPTSNIYNKLKRHTRNDPHWQIHQCAMGNILDKKKINITQSSDMTSFLGASETGKALYNENLIINSQELVQINTIDQFIKNNIPDFANKKVLLKTDTQGYDLQVIEGAQQSLSGIIGILSEISLIPLYQDMPHYLDAIKVYEQLGFSVTGLYPISRKKDLSIIEMDCMLINKKLAHD